MKPRALLLFACLLASTAAACGGRGAPASAPATAAADDPVMPPDAAARIMKACFVESEAMACTMLGAFFHEGALGYEKDTARADQLFARAGAIMSARCEAGDTEQCALLGGLMTIRLTKLEEGDPEREDIARRAAPLLDRGCRGGSSMACDALGEMYEKGLGLPRDPVRAEALYAAGCDLAGTRACAMLAEIRRARDDSSGAFAAYAAGCDAGVAEEAAKAKAEREEALEEQRRGTLEGERGVPPPTGPDPTRKQDARAPPSSAPSPWWVELCHMAGYQLAIGQGAAADERRSARYYERACARGSAGACSGLGVLHARGVIGPADPARAARLFRKACDAGEPSGCALLGHLHDIGEGVPKDPARARELFKKGCDGGDERACQELVRAGGPNRLILSPGAF